MIHNPHHRGQSAGREVVRVGAFERSLERFMVEMGQRIALTLSEFDRLQLEPLRQRLLALEAKPKRGRPRKTVAPVDVATEAAGAPSDVVTGGYDPYPRGIK